MPHLTPFALPCQPTLQVWCGRLAMAGFVTSFVEEAMTGRGTLGQLGFQPPSGGLLGALVAITGLAVLAGSASTAVKLFNREMSAK